MNDHIPDLTKMIGDTPISDSTPHNVADLGMLCRQLERQFNAANERIKRLEEELNENGLVLQKIQRERDGSNERIKRLEEAGDAILNATSDDEQYKAMKQWRKAEEAKL